MAKADKGGAKQPQPQPQPQPPGEKCMEKWLQEKSLPPSMAVIIAKYGVSRPEDLNDLEPDTLETIFKEAALKDAEKKRFKAGQKQVKTDADNGWTMGSEWSLVINLMDYLVEKEIVDCLRLRLEAQRSHLDTFTLLLGIITSTLGAASSGEAETESEAEDLAVLCGYADGNGGGGDADGDGDGDADGAVAGGQIYTYVMLALSMVLTFSLALKKLFKTDERITAVQTLQDATNQLVGHYLHELQLKKERDRMAFSSFETKATALRNTVLKAKDNANITAYEGADCLREIKAGGGDWLAIQMMFEDDDATRDIEHRSCWVPLSSYPHLVRFNFAPVHKGPWWDLERCQIYVSFVDTHNLEIDEKVKKIYLEGTLKKWMEDGEYLKYKAALKGVKPADLRWDGTMKPIEGVPTPDGMGGSIL
jgi:hypothetical protein